MVFVVSQDAEARDSIRKLVESVGLLAEVFPTLQAFFDAGVLDHGGCLVLDAHVGDLGDEKSSARLAATCARMAGIFLTERGDVPMAVRALKAGAVEVVQKPYKDSDLLKLIEGALQPGPPKHP